MAQRQRTSAGGFSLPWVYTRRALADKWGIPPWHIEHVVPIDEIHLELQISAIEAEVAAMDLKPVKPALR